MELAKRKVIVKRLAAIHDLGAMDMLCTDKTGTLTEASIALVRTIDGRGQESSRAYTYAFVNSQFESGMKSPLDEAILADAMEQVAFGTENATWRNAFLTGAHELRNGVFVSPISIGSFEMVSALTVTQLFNALGARIDGPAAWDARLTIGFEITDEQRTYLVELRNGALHHRLGTPPVGTTIFRLDRVGLITTAFGVAIGLLTLEAALGSGSIEVTGDPAVLGELLGYLELPASAFPIVTP